MQEKGNTIWRGTQGKRTDREHKWGQESLALLRRIHSSNHPTGMGSVPSVLPGFKLGPLASGGGKAQPVPSRSDVAGWRE